MTNLNSHNIVNHIEDIFNRRGAESYLGEDVTMSQHMLQAAQCAKKSGADDSLIVAALLHDIGHYQNEIPETALAKGKNNYHEEAGANFFRRLLSTICCRAYSTTCCHKALPLCSQTRILRIALCCIDRHS